MRIRPRSVFLHSVLPSLRVSVRLSYFRTRISFIFHDGEFISWFSRAHVAIYLSRRSVKIDMLIVWIFFAFFLVGRLGISYRYLKRDCWRRSSLHYRRVAVEDRCFLRNAFPTFVFYLSGINLFCRTYHNKDAHEDGHGRVTRREGPTGVRDKICWVDGVCAGVWKKISAKRIRELHNWNATFVFKRLNDVARETQNTLQISVQPTVYSMAEYKEQMVSSPPYDRSSGITIP